MSYSCSAPGTLMLFGEHAVLRGKQAICCAVDQRIRVELTPRQDLIIHLRSANLGEAELHLNSFSVTAPFEFVTTAILHFLPQIQQGFDLIIFADFSATMGLGSSAAVTVATIGVLQAWLQKTIIRHEVFKIAKDVIVKVQGLGSGADAAAAVFGGVVAYQVDPIMIQSFPIQLPVTLVYSGAKTPTKTVIDYVNKQETENPAYYQKIFNAMHDCARQAMGMISEQNWSKLGELMNQHQSLQVELGVSTPLIDGLIDHLRAESSIYGAKISGSGLGDCVIALGSLSKTLFPINEMQRQAGVQQIPVKIGLDGLQSGERCDETGRR